MDALQTLAQKAAAVSRLNFNRGCVVLASVVLVLICLAYAILQNISDKMTDEVIGYFARKYPESTVKSVSVVEGDFDALYYKVDYQETSGPVKARLILYEKVAIAGWRITRDWEEEIGE